MVRVEVVLARLVPFHQFAEAVSDAIEEGVDPDLFERLEVVDVREG
jgi:hypothetical protein